jgi:hypothetical protein
MLANSVDRHGQSSQETAYSDTPSRVCRNVWVPHYSGSTTVIVFSNDVEFLFIAPWPLRIVPIRF